MSSPPRWFTPLIAALVVLAACAPEPVPAPSPARPSVPLLPAPSAPPPALPAPALVAPSAAPDAGDDGGVSAPDLAAGRGLVLSIERDGVGKLMNGQPVSIVVTLRNADVEPATIEALPAGLDYDVVMIDDEGRKHPPTRYGRKRASMRATASAATRTLLPGEAVKTSLLANRLVDTSEPGRYRLTVVRRAEGTRGTSTSNEVVFEVY